MMPRSYTRNSLESNQEAYLVRSLRGMGSWGCLGFGKRFDVVDHYEKKLEKLEDDMRLKQSLPAGEEIPAAFVSFRTRHGAAIASNIQQGMDPTQWLTETAPEPQDVHWPFFTASFVRRWISNVVVFVAFVALIILYVIPVVLVQGLANLHQLETWFPFLKSILNMKIVSQVPSLIFQLFLMIVPPVMLLLSSMQGFISHSQIEKSACIKLLVFTLSQHRFYCFETNESWLISMVQASFFISYVVSCDHWVDWFIIRDLPSGSSSLEFYEETFR